MIEKYIAPYEAVRLVGYAKADEFITAKSIFHAAIVTDPFSDLPAALVTFHAGVIAGIRMERARRRKNK